MSAIYRIDNNGADGALVDRTELELVTGTVQYRRFGPTLTLVESRVATAKEAAFYIAWDAGETTQTNRDSLTSKAQQALAANSTFLAIASPTAAQTLTQVQRLTRENDALIRLLLGLLDSTADT